MKKIGNAIYFHISKLDTTDVFDKLGILAWLFISDLIEKKLLPIEPTIIKWDDKKQAITFINSPDWDSAREPIVGDAYRYKLCEYDTSKFIKSKGQIYHHKWMFVDDDYTGFDIEESKRWSEQWQQALPKDRIVKSRIGYKKYWNEYLEEYGLEIEK